MRLWVKPDQLAKLNITVTEIVNAIQAQNKVNPRVNSAANPLPRTSNSRIPFLLRAV